MTTIYDERTGRTVAYDEPAEFVTECGCIYEVDSLDGGPQISSRIYACQLHDLAETLDAAALNASEAAATLNRRTGAASMAYLDGKATALRSVASMLRDLAQ